MPASTIALRCSPRSRPPTARPTCASRPRPTAAPRCGNPNADDPYAPPPAVAEFRLFPDTIGTPKSPGDIGTLDRLELWWNHDVLSKF